MAWVRRSERTRVTKRAFFKILGSRTRRLLDGANIGINDDWRLKMKTNLTKAAIVATTLSATSTVWAGAVRAPVEAPLMGPWALGIMAVLVASVAYWIKKK